MIETQHVPVLLQETVDALNLQNGMTVVDATLGGGSHSIEILKQIFPEGALLAIDADESAVERFKQRITGDTELQKRAADGQIRVYHRNFSELSDVLKEAGIETVQGIMADLGFSSDQIEDAKRGLSFLKDGPLDMRLDPRETLTAEYIVNTYDETELSRILREYGDERFARRIVRSIMKERRDRLIRTTGELSEIVKRSVPAAKRHQGIHPATQTFQALRIAVNREFERLETFLAQAVAVLESRGRLAVISFHSGEDRIVKRFVQNNAKGCVCPKDFPVCRCSHVALVRNVLRKPIVPVAGEVAHNPRARSAKLRVMEKL